MIAVIVFRPEIRDEDTDYPFEGYEVVGVRPNNFLAEALMEETEARAKAIGQATDGWQWQLHPIPVANEYKPPVFTWTGWSTGEDCEPPEPGKQWLTIWADDEEYAIIVLRPGAYDRQADVTAAEAVLEIRADTIVRALNDMVARGDFPA